MLIYWSFLIGFYFYLLVLGYNFYLLVFLIGFNVNLLYFLKCVLIQQLNITQLVFKLRVKLQFLLQFFLSLHKNMNIYAFVLVEVNRDHIFHVTFPKEWRPSDLHILFQPYGRLIKCHSCL